MELEPKLVLSSASLRMECRSAAANDRSEPILPNAAGCTKVSFLQRDGPGQHTRAYAPKGVLSGNDAILLWSVLR